MLLPQFVFVEALPDRIFFDVEEKFRGMFVKLKLFRSYNGGDRVAARSHS